MCKDEGESSYLYIFASTMLPMEKHNGILITSHRFASHSHLIAFWKQIEPATHKITRVTRATGGTAKADVVPHTVKVTVTIFSSFYLAVLTKHITALYFFLSSL